MEPFHTQNKAAMLRLLTICCILALASKTLAQSTPSLALIGGNVSSIPTQSSAPVAELESSPKPTSKSKPDVVQISSLASGSTKSGDTGPTTQGPLDGSTKLPSATNSTAQSNSTQVPEVKAEAKNKTNQNRTTPSSSAGGNSDRKSSRKKSTKDTAGTNQSNKQSIFDENRSYGHLCQEGDDEVGVKLACDCLYNSGDSLADCSRRSIKIGSPTIPIPQKLNVSNHVRRLDLSWNEIERIDLNTFNEVSGIIELNLSNNRITFVDNLNVPRMEFLDLSFNKITNLTKSLFQNSKKILHLDLSHNNLTYIDTDTFTSLEYLQTLKLGFNKLESILNYMENYPFVLENMTHLEELDLTNGSLPDVPEFALRGTTNLKRLILQNNLLSYLPTGLLSKLPALEVLDLSGNYFQVLPPSGFHGLGMLKTLLIDRGRTLERIEEYAFSGLPSLVILSCENNYHLNYIDVLAFRGNPIRNESECNPKDVRLAYNNLNHFDYPLLKWPLLEALELFGNPWLCDCNMQWVTEYIRQERSNASVLIDPDFICDEPKLLKGVHFAEIDPDEMYCDSPVAMLAGIIALGVFSLILVCFVLIVFLYQLRVLPQGFEKFLGDLKDRTSGSSLPKYSKVQPKPSGIRHHRLVNHRSPEIPPDLDWDTGDIGHLNY